MAGSPEVTAFILAGGKSTRMGTDKAFVEYDGRTLLAGTTWYTDQIWPSPYWKLWSDYIIHHIHLRVLNHIKAVSENTPG